MPGGFPGMGALPPGMGAPGAAPGGFGLDQLPPGFDPSQLKFPKK
jgi:signal recognition particle subunit SRP54